MQVRFFCFLYILALVWKPTFPKIPVPLHHGKKAAKATHYFMVPARLILGVGEIKKLNIVGRHLEDLSPELDNPEICTLVSDSLPFLIKGLHAGTAHLQLTSQNVVRQTTLVVKEFAGSFPKEIPLTVTGKKFSSSALQKTILEMLKEEITRKPNTYLSLSFRRSWSSYGLRQGENSFVPVDVEITGKEYLSVKKRLTINIANIPFNSTTVSHLMVSNNPESFHGPGTLFQETFPEVSPVRFFFHHYNKAKKAYRFVVELLNPSDENARIHLMEGIAGPDPHELSVGKHAAERFLRSVKDQFGYVAQIKPHLSTTLFSTMMNPGESISGIIQLTPLSNTKPVVITRITSNHEESANGELPEEEANKPRGIFFGPDVSVNAEYTVNGDYTFIPIGKESFLADLQTGKPNLGSYGVFYTVHLTLRNPTTSPAPVHLFFSPQAGPANGVFLVDEQRFVITPVIAPFKLYPLESLTLGPEKITEITLETIPQGGSFYPVNLVVQP